MRSYAFLFIIFPYPQYKTKYPSIHPSPIFTSLENDFNQIERAVSNNQQDEIEGNRVENDEQNDEEQNDPQLPSNGGML